jgi:hypothetical protein
MLADVPIQSGINCLFLCFVLACAPRFVDEMVV